MNNVIEDNSNTKSRKLMRFGLRLNALVSLVGVVVFIFFSFISTDSKSGVFLGKWITTALTAFTFYQMASLLLCVRESVNRGLGIPISAAILSWLISFVLLANLFFPMIKLPKPELTLYLSMVIAFGIQIFYLLGLAIMTNNKLTQALGQLLILSWGIASAMYVSYYFLALNHADADFQSISVLVAILFYGGILSVLATSVFYIWTLCRLIRVV
jgi:hypothetical protein